MIRVSDFLDTIGVNTRMPYNDGDYRSALNILSSRIRYEHVTFGNLARAAFAIEQAREKAIKAVMPLGRRHMVQLLAVYILILLTVGAIAAVPRLVARPKRSSRSHPGASEPSERATQVTQAEPALAEVD